MSQDEISAAQDLDASPINTLADPMTDNDNAAGDLGAVTDHNTDDSGLQDADLDAAKAAWEGDTFRHGESGVDTVQVNEEDLRRAAELAEPFVGQWNQLISTTNWEKGQIISQWRSRLIESGVDASQYSDDAWSRRVGGVTAPHVGRLRRVFERFGADHRTYEGLYWSHFLAALDWQDAPLWLEGAAREKWSISVMREKRWQAEGAVDSQRPTASQIVEVDTDEDFTEPAQGGGKTRDYDNNSGGVASGPTYEGPDFGDEEELQSLAGAPTTGATGMQADGAPNPPAATVQPFIGLPALPDDLSDAIESLKLAILRHKAAEWRDVDIEIVERYLQAVGIMLRS